MYVGSRLKRAWKSGRRHLKSLPSSRTGENPPYGMIGGGRGNVGIIRSPVRASILPDRADELAKVEAASRVGDYDIANVTVGESIGMIHDLPHAGDVVRRVVDEAEERLAVGAALRRVQAPTRTEAE